MQKQTVKVEAKCVCCGCTKEIGPGEIAPDSVPFCDQCGSPMVATQAKTKRNKKR